MPGSSTPGAHASAASRAPRPGPYVPSAVALLASTLACPCPVRRDDTWVWERCPRCDSVWHIAEAAWHWQEDPDHG